MTFRNFAIRLIGAYCTPQKEPFPNLLRGGSREKRPARPSPIPHKHSTPCPSAVPGRLQRREHIALKGVLSSHRDEPRRIRRLMNPAFFGISCPVFSVSWLESSDEAATNESFALFSGGGGAAKTGVHNKIVNILIYSTTSHGLRLTIQSTFICHRSIIILCRNIRVSIK